jgi:hypothetical protein
MCLLEQTALSFEESPAEGNMSVRDGDGGHKDQDQSSQGRPELRATYTERFRSSLIGRISIFLRPMVGYCARRRGETDGDK